MGKMLTFSKDFDPEFSPGWYLVFNKPSPTAQDLRLEFGIHDPDGKRIVTRGVPTQAALLLEKFHPPTFEYHEGTERYLIKEGELRISKFPRRPKGEKSWSPEIPYRKGFRVQYGGRVYEALTDLRSGIPVSDQEGWVRATQQAYRIWESKGSNLRYVYLSGYAETRTHPGVIPKTGRIGAVDVFTTVLFRPDTCERGYVGEYCLGLRPGTAVKFRLSDGTDYVLVYPIKTKFPEGTNICEDVGCIEGWATFDAWVKENPLWDKPEAVEETVGVTPFDEFLLRNSPKPNRQEHQKREQRPDAARENDDIGWSLGLPPLEEGGAE